MIKVLFICHGNICRSPMGEFVMKDLAVRAGFSVLGVNCDSEGVADFRIDSAATSTEEIGNPVYPPARRKLAEHGIDCSGKKSRQIQRSDYDYYDYIICMDEYNLRNVNRMIGPDVEGKVHMMLEYAGRDGDSVADPWYTGDFDETWRDVSAGCKGLLEALRK